MLQLKTFMDGECWRIVRSRRPSDKVSTSGRRFSETRFQSRSAMYIGLLHVKSYVVAKRPALGTVRKFGEWVAAQVSSSSSVQKLRGPSQNSPRVASKQIVNSLIAYPAIWK
ncbi:hypothetical protein AVEN_148513-1 [Araneus ventricosus]|uniref:Uncharacterized protein n=1 Tax=Araneus ventricosus TaxID=182803 RepID=A0A4Y2JS98_ARAVE|nr:hypothetical protein AVEN_148513-1 [Araneus ventricosus]